MDAQLRDLGHERSKINGEIFRLQSEIKAAERLSDAVGNEFSARRSLYHQQKSREAKVEKAVKQLEGEGDIRLTGFGGREVPRA